MPTMSQETPVLKQDSEMTFHKKIFPKGTDKFFRLITQDRHLNFVFIFWKQHFIRLLTLTPILLLQLAAALAHLDWSRVSPKRRENTTADWRTSRRDTRVLNQGSGQTEAGFPSRCLPHQYGTSRTWNVRK
ncbi:unnamed protein product [Nezara viridula]|uniref:Uncharacterized protein n=1 Tax=Nezara viridula TaxID=85310 RepID=A0A9P0E077_NEZVI|nr:unnamed protein product [Nezara viridula]